MPEKRGQLGAHPGGALRKGWETAKNRTSHHQPERLPDFHCLRRLANARGPNYPPDKVRH